MRSSEILTIARRRAGISQAELASRMGIARTNVTRWESGDVLPSFERLNEVVEACGLELGTRLWMFDDSYSSLIVKQLLRDPLGRFERMGGEPAQLLAATGAIEGSGISYVAIGQIAACLRGSPVTLGAAGLHLVVDHSQVEAMKEAIEDAGIDGSWFDFSPEPPATRGLADLLSGSEPIELVEDLALQTASTIDLRRIADDPDAGYQPSAAVLTEILRVEAGEPRAESRQRAANELELLASG